MAKKILLIAAALIMAMAAPALAGGDGYRPLQVSSEVNTDGSITLRGENCAPNELVTYEVRRAVNGFRGAPGGNGGIVDSGSGFADADGSFVITTNQLPPGTYEITVTCGDRTVLLTATVPGATGAQPTAATGSLATTGSDSSIPLARLGVILMAAGGVAVYAAKKRRGRGSAFSAT